jgi:hypothetical protein
MKTITKGLAAAAIAVVDAGCANPNYGATVSGSQIK